MKQEMKIEDNSEERLSAGTLTLKKKNRHIENILRGKEKRLCQEGAVKEVIGMKH